MCLMSRLTAEVSTRKALTLCFILGFIVRLIPEILAFPYPISWDMVHYAYFMRVGIVWPHWGSFFTSTWLLYAFLFPIHNQFGIDSFLLLKITGPVLFGFNVCGVYWFARSVLNWKGKRSLLVAGFFAVQLASLRISWEFLRNTLGLGLLLFTLPLIKKLDSKRGFAAFILLSLLTVFGHEYAAATLLVISSALIILGLVKGKEQQKVRAKRLIFAISPSLTVFLVGLYLRMFPVPYEHPPPVGPNLVYAKDTVQSSYGKMFFFVDYLGMNTSIDIYPNYLFLVLSVVALFALLYGSYIYLVWKGFFRNEVLDIWTGLLLFGSFNCVVTPFFALQYWHRWMFMLVYPFTFYAVNGLEVLWKRMKKEKISVNLRMLKGFRDKASAMVLATVLLGAIYSATPFLMVNVGFGIYALFPVCRYFASSPTVPYQDVNGTIQAIHWLKDNMNGDSCAVMHSAFVAWAKLYLENSHNVIGYRNNVTLALDLALQEGYKHIYFVCWNRNIGWYGVYVPKGFVEIERFNRISVFEYSNI